MAKQQSYKQGRNRPHCRRIVVLFIIPITILPSQVQYSTHQSRFIFISTIMVAITQEHTTSAYDEQIGLVAPTGLDINLSNNSSSSSSNVRRATSTSTSTSTPSGTSSAAVANVDLPSWNLTAEQIVVLIIGLLLLPILMFALYRFGQRLVQAWRLRRHHPAAHASLSPGNVDVEKAGDPSKSKEDL